MTLKILNISYSFFALALKFKELAELTLNVAKHQGNRMYGI